MRHHKMSSSNFLQPKQGSKILYSEQSQEVKLNTAFKRYKAKVNSSLLVFISHSKTVFNFINHSFYILQNPTSPLYDFVSALIMFKYNK